MSDLPGHGVWLESGPVEVMLIAYLLSVQPGELSSYP
jgi:hypothetical protein